MKEVLKLIFKSIHCKIGNNVAAAHNKVEVWGGEYGATLADKKTFTQWDRQRVDKKVQRSKGVQGMSLETVKMYKF